MVPINIDTEKYVLLSEVTENCPSLAEKWSRFTEKWSNYGKKTTTLENRLVLRACQGILNLYCFKPVPPSPEKRLFSLGRIHVNNLKDRFSTARCVPFFDNPKDQIKVDIQSIIDSKIDVEVSWTDLYLDLDELAEWEKTDPDFVKLENADSKLEESGGIETNQKTFDISSISPGIVRRRTHAERENNNQPPLPKETNNESGVIAQAERPIIEKTASIGTGIVRRRSHAERELSKNNSEVIPPISPNLEMKEILDIPPSLPKKIDKESEVIAQAERPKIEEKQGEKLEVVSRCSRAEKLSGENNPESESPPSFELETVANLDNQPLLSGGNDEESKLTTRIAQVKKPSKIKEPSKKKKKSDLHIVDGVVAPPLQCNDDQVLSTPKIMAVTEERYLRVWEIVGDEKKGIPAMVPFKKTTWWAGVKSGRFPQPIKMGPRCTVWKASDIYALLKDLGKGIE